MRRIFIKCIHTLIGRVTLHVALFAVVAVLVIFTVFLHMEKRKLADGAARYTIAEMDAIANHIEDQLHAAEIGVDSYTWMFASGSNNPDSIRKGLSRIIESDDNISMCTIAFAPGYFPDKGRYYAITATRSDDGMEYGKPDEEIPEYEYLNWYIVPSLTKAPYWDDPNVAPSSGAENADSDKVLATYSKPLFDESGKMYAVLAVEVSLGYIMKLVGDMKAFPASCNVLLDRKGMHITPTDSVLVFQKAFYADAYGADTDAVKQMRSDISAGRSGYLLYKCDDSDYYFFYRHFKKTGWEIISICPAKEVVSGVERYAVWASLLAIVFIAVIVFVCQMLVRRVLHPIDNITAAMRSIARGKYDNELVPYRYKDEIWRMRSTFAYMQRSMALRQEKIRNEIWLQEKVDTDMRLASFMRQNIMQMNAPLPSDMKAIDVSAHTQPAKIMAGDMYQYFIVGDMFYFLFMGVSARGTLASIVMSTVCRIFRAELPRTNQPAQIADLINRSLAQGNAECVFCPLLIGIINTSTGEMTYCNAGHPAPVLIAPHSEPSMLDVKPHLPIAAFPDTVYAEQSVILEKGSVLCLYSDGVTDAANADMALYGEERLMKALSDCAEKPAKEIVHGMVQDVQSFIGSADQVDDISVMVIRYGDI